MKPYKFNRDIYRRDTGAYARVQECEVGVAKVRSLVWEKQQPSEIGTREPEGRRPGTLWRGGRGPRAIRVVTRPKEQGWRWVLRNGGKKCACVF